MAVMPLLIAIAVIVLIGLWLLATYNGLVKARNRTENAWAQVDVQLKKRYDLVPNIVETVKGYADHERSTLEAVVQARNVAQQADSVPEQAQAEGMLTTALRQVFALAEAYPELRASEGFRTLQVQLTDIEGDIAVSRQIYNDTILTYNNKVETVPTNLVAGMTGFERRASFEIEDDGRSVPKVEF
jgi:LemA protein